MPSKAKCGLGQSQELRTSKEGRFICSEVTAFQGLHQQEASQEPELDIEPRYSNMGYQHLNCPIFEK